MRVYWIQVITYSLYFDSDSFEPLFLNYNNNSKMNNKNLNLGLAIVMFFGTSYMAFKKEKREDYDKLDTRSLAEEYVKLIKANEIVKNYKQVELK